ncbi:energy-coupling factor ABC transporter ATP-binding protein [Roseovarius nanhaiticus]|uniref:energy-coupling factor ABC transporter ATP-binding protein n=1 Tax=Roseovarius nanhaiticus TaxID=573024 RepID=UPI002491A441|nr:ABC transporter ATP-binding protein [Roseovarius nanhaiticus]
MGVTLDIENVSLTLDGRAILRGVTLRGNEARIGIVGRNGSGKSTLARVIAGLQPVDTGHVRVGGIDVARDRRGAIRTVGILFQNPDHQIIFPTVDEEIAFGLRQLGQSKTEAAEGVRAILARFGKAHWAGAAIHPLSQGQKQLVCLMSILAMRPALIVLDEPLSGLDIPTRMQLMRYLDSAEAQLIHISHDPELLAGYDRALWITDGQIAEDGVPDRVLPAFTAEMQRLGGMDDIADLAG